MSDTALMKIPEVARRLSLSRSKTYQLVYEGRIPSVTIGRSRRVRPEDLDVFLASLTGVPQGHRMA